MKTIFARLLSGGLMAIAAGIMFSHNAANAEQTVPEAMIAFAHQAVSANPNEARAATKTLRDAGPVGMQALSEVYGGEIARHWQGSRPEGAVAADESWTRLCAAFDDVGQQRDNYASQLYWYTNLDQAEAAARAAGRPILSLRLLGKLNEEYSCANSRFFRTTLYPNAEVSQYLRANFILHWQSVRPVPRITIDMGDGRKIERTITGNSIHYILDPDGRPVDALPGLYGAQAFIAGLTRARDAAQKSAGMDEAKRITFLREYHAAELDRVKLEWARDLSRIGPEPQAGPGAVPGKYPDATLEGFLPNSNCWLLDESTRDDAWRQMATLHAEDVRLDVGALALIRAKQPTMAEAMRLTTSKAIVETPMMRMIRNLRHSIAEDTVRNEYEIHTRLHEWFAGGYVPFNLDALNSRVYAELFLTPETDPWLGLAPADVFSALDHGGLVQNNPPRRLK